MDINSTLILNTGNKIPILGLGTWQLSENTTETIEFALNLGYILIDTSSDYGTQPGIGAALKNFPREKFYIVTKVEETDDAYRRTEKNLEELQLDYLDLLLIHRPPEDQSGKKLWDGLLQAKNQGLTKDVGVSNYPIALINELIESSGETPAVNQIEWSPFGHSNELLSYCNDREIKIMAYSPLTRGKRLDNPMILHLSEKYNKTPSQILIRWNLQIGTIPIPKANRKEHLKENIDVFDFNLSEDDIHNLDELNEGYSSLGALPYI